MDQDRDIPDEGRFPADPRLTPEELARLREQIEASPDLRMPRVMRVRRAIATPGYETERIDRVVEILSSDLEAACDLDVTCEF